MTQRAKRAFISHATPDDTFVVELKGLILALGYKAVFNDADYDSIVPGEEFWPRIFDGIRTSDAVVVVLSAKSVNSDWVIKEVEYARTLKKRVVPIRIDDCQIPELFRDRDVIDFRLGHRNLLDNAKSRPIRAYLARLTEMLDGKQGVLNFLPRIGSVDTTEDDEFGYSVLVAEAGRSTQVAMPFAEAIERHRTVVVTGDPGAGKSTALRRMARVMAANFARAGGNGTFPILIALTRWTDEKELDQAIQNSLKDTLPTSEILREMNYAVLLDGLNEVRDENVLKAIVAAVRKAVPGVGPIGLQHLIITCRSLDYGTGDGSLRHRLALPSISICPLTEKEIRAFCEAYLANKAGAFMEIIWQKNLLGLAGNAYMLSALIMIYQQRGAAEFPAKAEQLYPALTRALWQRESKRGYAGSLQFHELTKSLGKLAYWITVGHGFGEFALASIPPSLNPQHSVTELARRCGLLQGADESLRFNHQLTQEYFNAVWLKEIELSGLQQSYRFRNSLRILGGMEVGHLGVRLFGIYPEALSAWVHDGVYSRPDYIKLVRGLLDLAPSDSDYSVDERDALTAILAHDAEACGPVFLSYLEQEPKALNARSIALALGLVSRLTMEAEHTLLHLLDDGRIFSRHSRHLDYYTVATTCRMFLRELAAEVVFRLGSRKAVAEAIEKVLIWLDDSRLEEIEYGSSGIGNESKRERVGNRAFDLLLDRPAKTDPMLRRVLREWLQRQQAPGGVAEISEYSYFGTDVRNETAQAEWVQTRVKKLDSQSEGDRGN